MPFAIGENVGPYRVIEQLGQGGMATVYKAYHASLDRYVALKVMHAAFSEDPSFLARFQREARVVAKLDHPNIVPIFDFADHDGSPYLVMKFIEGETLKARLGRGPLARDEGLRIVDAVGQALSYAHGRGILHRDIKPSNVLLSPDGSVYLADFGLARIADASESTLSGDMLLGTPQYISPEQARGERNLDAGTDIYSFGVVLYELVVGRVPFTGDTPFSIIHDHIFTPLPLPQAINPNVPDTVQRVLLKALAKERADRFRSIEELVAAFRTALTPGASATPAETKIAPAMEYTATAISPVPSARQPGSPIDMAGSEAGVKARATPAVKSRRWLWVVGGLLIACGCLAAFVVVARNISKNAALNAPQTVSTSLPGAVADPTKIAGAKATLAVDQGDAGAWMALAQSDVAGGHPKLAVTEFHKAGDLYMQARAFGRAAGAYLDGLQAAGGPTGGDARLVQSATQALFYVSGEPAGTAVVERAASAFPEWNIVPSLQARVQLTAGNTDGAKAILDRALGADSSDPLANAALVEWNAKQGNREAAQQVAAKTLALPGLPGWLADFVNGILKRIGTP
jgi:serine/threonine-protein kinase